MNREELIKRLEEIDCDNNEWIVADFILANFTPRSQGKGGFDPKKALDVLDKLSGTAIDGRITGAEAYCLAIQKIKECLKAGTPESKPGRE